MKITCRVKSVVRYDDRLSITLLKDTPYIGEQDEHKITIPCTPVTRRAYHVGRLIKMDVNPK